MNLTIKDVDYEVARQAGRLRALKMPDGLVVATALSAGTAIVVASDARWASAIAIAAPMFALCHLDAHVPL